MGWRCFSRLTAVLPAAALMAAGINFDFIDHQSLARAEVEGDRLSEPGARGAQDDLSFGRPLRPVDAQAHDLAGLQIDGDVIGKLPVEISIDPRPLWIRLPAQGSAKRSVEK